MAEVEVIRLSGNRAKAAAGVLARAWWSDPLIAHRLPDEATRMPPLLWLMRGCVSFGHLYGQVYTTANLEAVAVCLTPQSPPANPWRLLRAGLAFAPLTSGRQRYDLLAGEIRRMGRLHSRDAPEPHWYVWFLGVEPAVQGRGLGSARLAVDSPTRRQRGRAMPPGRAQRGECRLLREARLRSL